MRSPADRLHNGRMAQRAYREAQFDARLLGSSREELVVFCLDEVVHALTMLDLAEQRGDPARRSSALTRAVTALTVLELGVERSAPLAASLLQLYGGAKMELLGFIRAADRGATARLRRDFADLAAAFAR